jgi:drug/metabolite transporter (DMT)-like permease
MRSNYRVVSLVALCGLVGVALAIPKWGVVLVVFFGLGFGLLNFFSSHYLNALVDSRHRATVLSFRGLALNLGFGGISLLYGAILRGLKEGDQATGSLAYRESLWWLPLIFAALWMTWWLHQRLRVHGTEEKAD